jgi:hypothetical protein
MVEVSDLRKLVDAQSRLLKAYRLGQWTGTGSALDEIIRLKVKLGIQ